MSDLEKARQEIDLIDEQIRLLFLQRMEAVTKVLEFKKSHQLPVLDQVREHSIKIEKLSKMNDHIFRKYYESLLDALLQISKAYQRDFYE